MIYMDFDKDFINSLWEKYFDKCSWLHLLLWIHWYIGTAAIAEMSNPSSLFGDRLLHMNYDNSIRHGLMSSMEYPVIECTL